MLSERIKKLKPSPTIALNTLAQELKKAGRDIVNLTAGEPDWDTFPHIKKAAHQAIDDGLTKYVPSAGLLELRQAVVNNIRNELGLSYDAGQVLIGIGGKHTLFVALQAICNEGDEVLIPAPYWVSYPTMSELAGAKPVIAICGSDSNFKMTAQILKKHLTPKTKVVILNSPSNPTGQVYSKDEIKELAQVLENHNCWVISDDIYDKMVFGSLDIAPHIAQLSEKLRPRVILANSLSKTYSMTGWRIGSLVGDKNLIAGCTNYISQSTTCAPAFIQKAALAALSGPQDCVKWSAQQLEQRLKLSLNILTQIKGVKTLEPKGAFYIFPDISPLFGKKSPSGVTITNSTQFASQLLEVEGVAIVPGIDFGLEGFIRISTTTNEKLLVQGLERIKTFVERLT